MRADIGRAKSTLLVLDTPISDTGVANTYKSGNPQVQANMGFTATVEKSGQVSRSLEMTQRDRQTVGRRTLFELLRGGKRYEISASAPSSDEFVFGVT